VSIFELHPAVFDVDHSADVAGLGVLDNQADLDGSFRGARPSVRVVGQDIAAVSISHRVILGSAPRPFERDTAERPFACRGLRRDFVDDGVDEAHLAEHRGR
jgi:hypothetical protein